MKGVGKTVLLDYITGRAFNRQYTLPKTSTQIEEGKAGKLVLKILPGVEARITFETEFLEESSNIDGIVYVAAYGFASTRQEDARKALAGQGIDTLEKYRELQLRGEIEFLEEACGFLRSYIKRYKKPAWMLVAVTKCDLYYSFAREAEQYYSPYGDSRFVKVLREFQARIGSDNFAWSPRPVCSRLEDFSWNGQLQSSVLKEEQRNHFLAAFLEKLNEYAEGRCFYE